MSDLYDFKNGYLDTLMRDRGADGCPDRVQFLSYDGSYPNLCSGTLILAIDGKPTVFPGYCLASEGRVWFDDSWCEHVESGPWKITDFPSDFPHELKAVAESVVNMYVSHGCCGGCV